jgi:hypothetical protein
MSIILIIYVTLIHLIKTNVNHLRMIDISFYNVTYIVRMIDISFYNVTYIVRMFDFSFYKMG